MGHSLYTMYIACLKCIRNDMGREKISTAKGYIRYSTFWFSGNQYDKSRVANFIRIRPLMKTGSDAKKMDPVTTQFLPVLFSLEIKVKITDILIMYYNFCQ